MNWDEYFLKIAETVALNSKCCSRHIGAVLVRDKAIISTGYNGPPRGMKPCWIDRWCVGYDRVGANIYDGYAYKFGCPRIERGYKSGEGLHLCPAAHAERNALIQAARTGVSTEGTTLYCFCEQVCKDCASEIVNAGVKRLVYLAGGKPYDNLAGHILAECGMEISVIDMPHLAKRV